MGDEQGAPVTPGRDGRDGRGGSPAVEIEEVVVGGRAPRRPPPSSAWRRRRPPGPGPATRAGLVVGGLAVAIIGVGLFGSRPASLPDAASPSPALDAAPRTPRPDVAVAAPIGPIPLVRSSGSPLADQHVLVAGRWMDLASGRAVAGAPDGCARQRVHVLGSGRIVCVTAEVTRTPGSRIALFDLGVVTVGAVRRDSGGLPPTGSPVGGTEPQALATLLGRRDVVIGDPVAIAVAPGPGPDDLVLAWAVADQGEYEVGLESFRLTDTEGPAERIGDWQVGRAPSTGRDAVETLADLSVAVDPGGGRAIVGWTESGRGIPGPARRLVAVRLDGSAPPVALPAAATRNLAAEAADGPLRMVKPCGGPFGEGFAGVGVAYVVCPGSTAELRLLDLGEQAGDSPGGVLATARLEPAGSTAGSAWLAGNGIVMDATRSILYRWSPAAGTIWRIELDGAGAVASDSSRAAPRVTALPLQPWGDAREADPAGDAASAAGPRPILALDAARNRLYALDAPLPALGRAVVHVVDLAGWRHQATFPIADPATRAITLSPDGALLYASTAPRPAGSLPLAVGVAVIDARTGMEIAYAGRLPVTAGAPLQAAVVR